MRQINFAAIFVRAVFHLKLKLPVLGYRVQELHPHVLLGQIIPLKNDSNVLSCAAGASTYETAGNPSFSNGSVTFPMCIWTCCYVHCSTGHPHFANVCCMMGVSVILHNYSPLQCE